MKESFKWNERNEKEGRKKVKVASAEALFCQTNGCLIVKML